MKGVISKKYVNALMKICNDDEISSIYNSIDEISKAFSYAKFNNIILSPDLSKNEKEKFVLSLQENVGVKLLNLIKLLAENDRLYLIPSISKELRYKISLKNNSYDGEVVSNFEISSEQITKLEDNLSKKFNANITLNGVVSSYPGVKIQLDDLGIEVSFSLDRLKSQMVEHILKAI
jgi:F-type H+-transporting ATPase subunit delta